MKLVPVLALALAVALPLGAAAKTKHTANATTTAAAPTGVSCASGDPVVWVNTETKVYHMMGSAYYGKTKHGRYACASDATKMGAHLAKREGGATNGSAMNGGGAMNGGAMNGGTTGADTSSGTTAGAGSSGGKRHHHKKGGQMGTPMTSPTPM